jgi:hypothetical protein
MFESRSRQPSREELRATVFVSLGISILAYFAMAIGWMACIVELEQGHDSSLCDTLIVAGFIAAVVALTRGGVYALVLSHFERRDEVQRGLQIRSDGEATREVQSQETVAQSNSGRTGDP